MEKVITVNVSTSTEIIGARVTRNTRILLDAVSRARNDDDRSTTIRAAIDEFLAQHVRGTKKPEGK